MATQGFVASHMVGSSDYPMLLSIHSLSDSSQRLSSDSCAHTQSACRFCSPSPSLKAMGIQDSMDDSSLETLTIGAWDRADAVLQSLKESQSELLSRVQKLKEEWEVDVDFQMKSCDQEIEGFTYAHNAEVERLRMELQSQANALKDQWNKLQQDWQLEVVALTSPETNISSAMSSKR